MAAPRLEKKKARAMLRCIEAALRSGHKPPGHQVNAHKGEIGAVQVAVRKFGYSSATGSSHVVDAIRRALGHEPDWSLYQPRASDVKNPTVIAEQVFRHLRKHSATLDHMADVIGVSRGQIVDAIDALKSHGRNVHQFGESFSLEKTPAPVSSREIPEYLSRPDGTYLFGFTSDNHIGSKYARRDVLNSLYDHFATQGVDRVFNAGNWIDGEASFNKHDLLVHGMDPQLQKLAEEYPRRKGIETYAVAGDDHEGWYCQREGVDIGKYAERVMRENGRTDWHDLGYMEAYIRLRHAKTSASSMLHLIHPGGGTAYAISYTVQKIVESYDGGDKPAVLLAGHYHKLSYNVVRNVHAIQTGTTQDQTPFMRKKKIPAHVGGGVCKLTQDQKTGAITSCRIEFFNYFVKDYYNARWSHSGDVTWADRGAA